PGAFDYADRRSAYPPASNSDECTDDQERSERRALAPACGVADTLDRCTRAQQRALGEITTMKTLRTQIDIDASAEQVWDTLTNFADYSTWNQFITHLAGTLAPGEPLEVRIEPPGGAAMSFRPT